MWTCLKVGLPWDLVHLVLRAFWGLGRLGAASCLVERPWQQRADDKMQRSGQPVHSVDAAAPVWVGAGLM